MWTKAKVQPQTEAKESDKLLVFCGDEVLEIPARADDVTEVFNEMLNQMSQLLRHRRANLSDSPVF
jgi:hypothetical protein